MLPYNKINNVKISDIQPQSENVWLRTQKNLLDLNKYSYEYVTSQQIVAGYYDVPIFVGKPNTEYYLSHTYKEGYTPCDKTALYILITNSSNDNDVWLALAHSTIQPSQTSYYNGVMVSDENGYLYYRVHASLTKDIYDEFLNNTTAQLELGNVKTLYSEPTNNAVLVKNKTGYINTIKENVDVSVNKPTFSTPDLWIKHGKNMLNCAWERGQFNYYTGENVNNDTVRLRTVGLIRVEPDTTYTFSCKEEIGEFACTWFDINKNYITGIGAGGLAVKQYTFTTPANCYYIRLRIGDTDYPKSTTYDYNVQLEQNDHATTYSPFKNTELYVKNVNGDYEQIIDLTQLIDKQKDTIWTGRLKKDSSVLLSNVKRYIDIYIAIDFSGNQEALWNATAKYTLDTTVSRYNYSGTLIPSFDLSDGMEYYVSECCYDNVANTLTYTKAGFFNLNGTYSDRSNNDSYIVCRVDTYN